MEIEKVINQTRFKDTLQKAMINLFYTSNYFRDQHTTIFKQHDIQGQHYNVLRILKGKHPEPVTPGYIKNVILDKGTDLTRLVDKLVKMGWINRTHCTENKRKIHLLLTDYGLHQVIEITSHLDRFYENYRHLSNEDYDKLSRLLDKMRG